MARLLSAGVVLEDVVLQDVPGNNELLLAALGPAAATLESLCIERHDEDSDVQQRDREVSRKCSVA